MKLFYLILICIFPINSSAQSSDVKEKIENSNIYSEDALKEIKFSIDKIESCENSRSVDFVQSCRRDVSNSLGLAKNKINHAKNEANSIKEKATEISCSELEEQADKAKAYFHDAESKISDALGELYKVKYAKNLSKLTLHLSIANDNINQASIRINYAVNEMQNTLVTHENCD